MEHLKSIADFLRKQLEETEKKIQLLKETEPLSRKEIRLRISDMDTNIKWKNFVLKSYGVVDNILDILDDCFESFQEHIEEEYPNKNVFLIIGKQRSKTWQEFQIKVIKKLLDPSNYDDQYDFEDTANGCDEVAWDAAITVIKDFEQIQIIFLFHMKRLDNFYT